MGLKERYQNRERILAAREFTDRKEPTKAFEIAIKNQNDTAHVLVYYGIGGVGKTRLRKELVNLLSNEDIRFKELDIKWCVVDFESEKIIDPANIMFNLRNKLNDDYGIPFNSFNLVYSIYWQLTNPQLDLKKENPNLFEDGSLLSDIISTLGDLPMVGLIPKFIKLGGRLKGLSKKWWDRRGMRIINEIKSLDPRELLQLLPEYFADDIAEYLEKHPSKIAIFMDTYEILWNDNKNSKTYIYVDSWLQTLVACCPSDITWVIFGREKLRWASVDSEWEQHLDQHLLDRLSEEDCIYFLNSCGIRDKNILQNIIKESSGWPLYLDLAVDLFYTISKNGSIPTSEDFENCPISDIHRFTKYLGDNLAFTIELLSVCNYWNRDLFVGLVDTFKTYYPIEAFDQLVSYSFIESFQLFDNEPLKFYRMNKVMRTTLLKHASVDFKNRVNTFLLAYYNTLVSNINITTITHQDINNLNEYVYHIAQLFDAEGFLNKTQDLIPQLINQGQFNLVISLYNIFLNEYKKNVFQNHYVADLYISLGQLYTKTGRFELAKQSFETAEELLKHPISSNIDSSLPKTPYIELAKLYMHWADALSSKRDVQPLVTYKKSLEILNSLDLESAYCEEVEALKVEVSIKLGKYYIFLSENDLALYSYNAAIESCELILSNNPNNYSILRLKALAFEKKGELLSHLGNYEEAYKYYTNSITDYDKALQDKVSINYIETLTNQGLVYKRLSENLLKFKSLEESINATNKAIEIYDRVIKLSPEYITAYKNKGFAAVDFMPVLVENKEFEKAETLYTIGVDSFSKAIEVFPGEAQPINAIGMANTFLADLCMLKGNLPKALDLYNTAISQFNKAIDVDMYYVYAYKDKSIAFEKLGDLYVNLNDNLLAREYYDKSLACLTELLALMPKADYALSYKNKVSEKLGKLK